MNPVISLARSWLGPILGTIIGRMMPTSSSPWIADKLAAWAAAQPGHPAVQAVRLNQSVVRGLPLDDPSLNEIVVRVFKNAARGYLAFFRGMARGQASLPRASAVDDSLLRRLAQARQAGRGVFIYGPHMGNFDIGLLALHSHGVRPLILSLRDPDGSYKMDVAIRQRYGVEFTPISAASLRQAVRRLAHGGEVLTLVDRPDPEGELVPFFGRSARISVGHIRMALQTGAMLQPAVALLDGDGRYRVHGRQALQAKVNPGETRREAVQRLARATIRILEADIRKRPDEWLMFQPVWPELMAS